MRTLSLFLCFFVALNLLSAQSSVDWLRTWGGAEEDGALGLVSDDESNVYGLGYFRDSAGSMNSYGGSDVLLFKYNKYGNQVWQINLGSSGEDAGNDIAIDKNANLFICGYYRNGTLFFESDSLPNAGASDAFIAKTDSSGLVLWVLPIYSSSNELATAIACDEDGNVYAAGTFQDSIQLDQQTIYGIGGINNFIVKLDGSGNLLWYDVLSTPVIENVQALEVGPLQSLYLTGFFRDVLINATDTLYAAGFNDIFLAKYTSSGQFEFWKNFGGAASDFSFALAVDTSAVYLAGMFVDSAYFDNQSLISTGELDACLMRCALDGSVEWVRSIGGLDDCKPFDLSFNNESLWLVGLYDGVAWSGTDSINSRSSRHAPSDVFVAQFNKNGQAIELKSYGGSQIDYATAVVCVDSAIFVAGLIQDTVSFDSAIVITETDFSDIFLMKLLSVQTVAVEGLISDFDSFKLFPNPAAAFVNIEFSNKKNTAVEIILVDSRGSLIEKIYSSSSSVKTDQIGFDVSHLSSGIYYFVFDTGGGKRAISFLKTD